MEALKLFSMMWVLSQIDRDIIVNTERKGGTGNILYIFDDVDVTCSRLGKNETEVERETDFVLFCKVLTPRFESGMRVRSANHK